MKTRLSSALSIVLLGVLTFSMVGDVGTAFAASVCNGAQFVADVTIPDGTYINPGASFTKTWRLKNVGTCSWSTSYALVFVSGERMGALSPIFLPRYVSTNQSIDLTVEMTAPTGGGTYRGYWKLQNASGTQFGIGGGFGNPFWVEIRVLSPTQSTVAYDMVSEMCSAAWGYDGGPISCPVNNSKRDLGYVLKLDNPLMENGLPAGAPALLTIPQNKTNGAIHGVFPVDDIFRGDHFQAVIGCQYQAYNCAVMYQLEYMYAGQLITLWKFKEQYDGLFYQVDIDLSPIANRRNVQLVLTVMANGPAQGDQPLWINPRVVRNVNGTTITPTPVTPTSTTPTATTPTNTPVPTVSADCDRAQFISDITVPDGTVFAPNAPFSKTWRLKNVGTCTWTTAYAITFASGDRMGGVDTLIPQTVVPGQTVDVGINLTAPSLAGSYRGYWQLKNAAGALFGIGTTFDRPFYVDIRVSGSSTGGSTVLDFVNSVCTAQWASGAGALPCPGTDGDSRGFVLNVLNPMLENGATDSRPALLTFPQNTSNGYIQGTYPSFAVQSGDHFQTTLNCQYGASDCFVIFRVDAAVSGSGTQNLVTVGERYDGLYYTIDIDLSPLAGKNVNFMLSALANGAATGDRALWVAPRIIRGTGGGTVVTSTPESSTGTPTPTNAATGTPTSTPTGTPTGTPTNTPTPTPTATTASSANTYQNTKYGFRFTYPQGTIITNQTDNGARLSLPFAPGTNLMEKYVDVAVVEGANPCKSPSGAAIRSTTNVAVNGIQFLKETGDEGAAGNLYQVIAYSTLKSNACISLTLVMHSLDPGAMATPVPYYDLAAESAAITNMVSTFAWI